MSPPSSPATRAGPSDRAGFIDAPLIGPPTSAPQGYGAADRERRGLADGAHVGRDRGDDTHEEEGQEGLPSRGLERIADGTDDAGVDLGAEREPQGQGSDGGPAHWAST